MVMTYMLVPYNDAMRLGMGFNTFTQSLCVDGAVKFDHDNMISTNGGVPTLGKGPSQAVSYSSRVVEKLSEVIDTLNISYGAAVKRGTVEISGDTTAIDEDKIKTSDLNAVVSVKVQNQTTKLSDTATFQSMRGVAPNSKRFNEVYGDSFISGFVEGGEFTGVISIRVLERERTNLDKTTTEIKRSLGKGLKSSFTVDSFSINNSSERSAKDAVKNTETTISVHWIGGGQIKDAVKLWDIDTMFEAAAAFPAHVASSPQRTWAIVTKYSNNKSYVEWKQTCDKIYAPLEYSRIISYSQELFEDYFEYKQLVKQLQNMIVEPEKYKVRNVASTPTTATVTTAAPQKAVSTANPTVTPRSNSIAPTVPNVDASAAPAAILDVVQNLAQPMPLDIPTLVAARQAMFNEMTKIIDAIDVLSKDPGVIKRDIEKLQPNNDFIRSFLASALTAKKGKLVADSEVKLMIAPMIEEHVNEMSSKSSSPGTGFVKLSNLAPGTQDATIRVLDQDPTKSQDSKGAITGTGSANTSLPPSDPKVDPLDATGVQPEVKPVFLGPALTLTFDFDSLISPDVWNQIIPIQKGQVTSGISGSASTSKSNIPPPPTSDKRMITNSEYQQLRADSAQLPVVKAERDNFSVLYLNPANMPLYSGRSLTKKLQDTVDSHADKRGSYILADMLGNPDTTTTLDAFNDLDNLDGTWTPTAITVWYKDDAYLTGISTTYSNGQTLSHGTQQGSSQTVDFSKIDSNGKRGSLVYVQMKAAHTGNWNYPIVNYISFGITLALPFTIDPIHRQSTNEISMTIGPPAPGWEIKGFWGDSGLAIDRLSVIWGKI